MQLPQSPCDFPCKEATNLLVEFNEENLNKTGLCQDEQHPISQKHTGRWIGYSKMPLCVNECVNGSL